MSMNPRLVNPKLDALFNLILSLNDKSECYSLFSNILTGSELKAISARLEVARLLHHGYKYCEIEKEIKVSTATISRVKRCLAFGAEGYQKILDRLDENS